MKLSMLLSGIRTQNWHNLYKSIAHSYTNDDWELVIVSPYELPKELRKYDNIQWRQDWGSPCRCQQIALTMAQGEYINWASDDGVFTPNSHDIAFELLPFPVFDSDYKNIIVGKYTEGDNYTPDMLNDCYYELNYHDGSKCKYLPEHTPLINLGLVSRKLLIEMGGWDASRFEALPIAYNDFAVRARNKECNFIHQKEIMFTCSHTPGTSGDHGPVHTAQVFHDDPIFKMIYSRPEGQQRINIPLDNWENAPDVWARRFPNGN
jgi:hypothetical protein